MMSLSMGKNGLALFLFAIVTAGILASTYEGTKENIAIAERKAAEKALLEIVPAERIDNDLLLDTISLPVTAEAYLGKTGDSTIYIARKNKQVAAVIVPAVAADGYSGDIKMIAGVNRNGTIAGVRVLSHKETPGLGDKIDLKKSLWIKSFDKKSLSNTAENGWTVKKNGGDFDQFTGATITPRAVVHQVQKILTFVEKNKQQLFALTTNEKTLKAIPAKDNTTSIQHTSNYKP